MCLIGEQSDEDALCDLVDLDWYVGIGSCFSGFLGKIDCAPSDGFDPLKWRFGSKKSLRRSSPKNVSLKSTLLRFGDFWHDLGGRVGRVDWSQIAAGRDGARVFRSVGSVGSADSVKVPP